MESGNVAVMQPYLFPYLGYFHLIAAAKHFVFYDDVNFIKQGWINRNCILVAGRAFQFSVPVSNISSFRPIKDTRVAGLPRWFSKFDQTLTQAYGQAPYFQPVIKMLRELFTSSHPSIADLAIASIQQTFAYLEVPFPHLRSSARFPHTLGMQKAERLIAITKELGLCSYVNAPGGKNLYDKVHFAKSGIRLSFVKSETISYKQNSDTFVPNLSMIDTLMFNDRATVRGLLTRYTLE